MLANTWSSGPCRNRGLSQTQAQIKARRGGSCNLCRGFPLERELSSKAFTRRPLKRQIPFVGSTRFSILPIFVWKLAQPLRESQRRPPTRGRDSIKAPFDAVIGLKKRPSGSSDFAEAFLHSPESYPKPRKCLWKLLFDRHRQISSQCGNVGAMRIRKLQLCAEYWRRRCKK